MCYDFANTGHSSDDTLFFEECRSKKQVFSVILAGENKYISGTVSHIEGDTIFFHPNNEQYAGVLDSFNSASVMCKQVVVEEAT